MSLTSWLDEVTKSMASLDLSVRIWDEIANCTEQIQDLEPLTTPLNGDLSQH
jgi:hypothetical protein